MKWHTEQRKISDLVPTEHNPRQLTEKQFKDLKKSVEKFDLAEIPAINTDNQILAGHQRLKIMAALGRGAEVIDVRVPDRKLTKKECDEYIVRSNKNTGEWNMDALANCFEVEDLKEWGFEDKDMGIFDNGYGTDFSLKNGDKLPFQQITFTLADEQVKFINQKIEDVKKTEPFKYCETFGNENSNGNALYFLIRDMK